MTNLQRLEFEERDEQWQVTQHYSDGSTTPGESFPASDHERNPKQEQVDYRVRSEYPGYQVVNYTPSDNSDSKHYLLEVVPKQTI
jgi:hypothetical protein